MTSNDVMTLYALLDESRKETRAALSEVRDEIHGYRKDLNGRLRALEAAEARREGAGIGKAVIGKWVLGVAAVSASIGSVFGIIMAVAG